MKTVNVYDLTPKNGRKTFYGKAIVKEMSNGSKVLQSYNTDVVMIDKDGNLYRLWDDWSVTTGSHIKSFCGLNKKQYEQLPLKK